MAKDKKLVEKITEACEKNLDFYEGFPSFYGKESIRVCKVIKRKGKILVICENPKHKQRQG